MRLRTKITLFSAASKIIILLLFVVLLPPLVQRVALHNTDQRLLNHQDEVIRMIERRGIESFVAGEEAGSFGSYNLLKEEFISIEQIAPREPVYTITNSFRKVENEVVEYRVLSLTFEVDEQMYLMEIGRSLATIRENIRTLQEYIIYFLLAVVLITVFADLAFSKILFRPLELIVRRLQRIGHPGTFKPNTIRSTTDDFIYLNNTINNMMEQIQAAFVKEKEFISNVSHELQTPIAILQTRQENLLSDPETPENMLEKLVDNQKTLHRLKHIVQALLLISKVENEQYLKDEAVDIKILAEEVAEEIQDRAEAREITMHLETEAHWTLPKGNQALLFTMLFNVVNNAIKYNKPGGSITIKGNLLDNRYQLCVTDTGVGIPKEQLSNIFNRFKRLHSPDKESHGLGLAIVQTVAQYHQIKLTVDSTPGVGTTFCFRFPEK
ncbi:sensor histidine kinase [Botryobacter ruber]|uniref:sensor histidine kinase n=1 Tax=Botryobacter ruber TaxID=2171629 RepID=UPI000E0A1C87|nr:HAMP domain-containing sensor histidine kinase [Botryobacter ruber]